MDKELIKTLSLAGLYEKETKVYLAFLELGKGTVYQASKLTDLKRPIIYVISEKLAEKGYLMKFPDKKFTLYQAIDPLIIFRKMQDNAKMFFEMLPIFRTLSNKISERPRITYSDSKGGILNVYEKLNNYPDQLYISSYMRIEEKFPGIIDQWIRNYKRNKKKIMGRHLVSNTPEEKIFAQKFKDVGQDVRFSKDIFNIKMDFSICGNMLAITSLGKNLFAVTIESDDLSNSLKPIFEIAWAKGKEIK